jgi:aspartyl-tRNA(Asn)/glutamyl-tRNA(Gln) amidotransferase subunit C
MLGIKDIEKLAELARIEIPEGEKETLRKEVDLILDFVGQIKELTPPEPVKETGTIGNVFREDKEPHLPGEHTDALLREAPETEDGYVRVKKIL